MRRWQAVVFDVGETLLRPSPSFPILLERLLAERGHTLPEDAHRRVTAALRASLALMSERGEPFSTSAERSRAFWTALYTAVLEDLRISDPDGELTGYLYREFSRPERYHLFPDALPALRELRATGYRLGIISNFEAWVADRLVDLGVTALMETVVISGAVGVEKPDPAIFGLALEGLRLTPGEAVYVGDNPALDVEAPRALGMGAILLDREGRHDGYRPVVSSLLEVAGVLAR